MSDLEQQLEEIEALSSIFPTEFKQLDDSEKDSYFQKYPHWNAEKTRITNIVTIEMQPQEPDENGNIHGKSRSLAHFTFIYNFLFAVIAVLVAAMVQDYPTTSSVLFEIEGKKGLSPDQIEEAKVLCAKTAEENIGMSIVFMLTSSLQEWLQENNIPGHDGSMYSGNSDTKSISIN